MSTPIVSSDSGQFTDSSSPIRIHQTDTFHGYEFQDDHGDINVYNSDTGQFVDSGYPAYSTNPFQSMSFISMTISSYYEISLDVVAHT